MAFKDIAKLKLGLAEKVNALRALQTEIDSREDKKLSDDEKTKVNSLMEEINNRQSELNVEELLQKAELNSKQNNNRKEFKEKSEFRNIGEVIEAIIENRTEKLVRKESRTMTAGNGPSAGFLLPDEFGGMLKSFEPGMALVRPRAQYLGGGSDATISFNAFDQSGSKGIYGGVAVHWICETGTKQNAGDLSYNQLKLEPQEVAAYMDVSNKLLRNVSEVSGYIESQMRNAINGSEDEKFVSGSGVGCPLGFIGHPSSIEINRNTASTVKYVDIVNMYCRAHYSSSLVWVVNQTVLPQLMQMVDAVGNLIWQPNGRESSPSTILGINVVYSDLLPVLGNKGDICLCDFQYYGIRDGSPSSILVDNLTQSLNQITRIYIYWNVDGQPLLTTPLLLRDGSTTVSPFIVLK